MVEFHIALDGRGDLAARVYQALRDGVRDGRLRPGDRLPPSRELARRLHVARNTVATAYERLIAEGFLAGRVGSGTFVTEAAAVRPREAAQAAGAGLRPRSGWTFTSWPVRTERPASRYDFQVGVPDARLFPFDTWRRLVGSELRLRSGRTGDYAAPAGHDGLRAAIARYVGYARSVRADADDVVVTNGAQQALDLIGRVLVAPGDVVAVEEPGYPPARDVFDSHGARVVGVPVDGDGLVVSRASST